MPARKASTVYPSRVGGFPPSTWLDSADAFAEASQRTLTSPVGICVCPALSFPIHWADIQRRGPLPEKH